MSCADEVFGKSSVGDPASGLYALALIVVVTLVGAPHNIATLYLMPEVQGEEYASFRAERVGGAVRDGVRFSHLRSIPSSRP